MAELTTTLTSNQRLQKQTLSNLRSCFEDTTGHDPEGWTKDQIINEVLFHFNSEYREDYLANLEDYEEN